MGEAWQEGLGSQRPMKVPVVGREREPVVPTWEAGPGAELVLPSLGFIVFPDETGQGWQERLLGGARGPSPAPASR